MPHFLRMVYPKKSEANKKSDIITPNYWIIRLKLCLLNIEIVYMKEISQIQKELSTGNLPIGMHWSNFQINEKYKY